MENEIMSANVNTNSITSNHSMVPITNVITAYCSMAALTKEDQKILFNAISTPQYRIKDCINTVINVKDVFIEPADMTREDGSVQTVPRIVLIDTEGKSYSATSFGVYNALSRLITICGRPTWPDGIAIRIKQVSNGKNNTLTFEMA